VEEPAQSVSVQVGKVQEFYPELTMICPSDGGGMDGDGCAQVGRPDQELDSGSEIDRDRTCHSAASGGNVERCAFANIGVADCRKENP
jgi:hypothetical protein